MSCPSCLLLRGGRGLLRRGSGRGGGRRCCSSGSSCSSSRRGGRRFRFLRRGGGGRLTGSRGGSSLRSCGGACLGRKSNRPERKYGCRKQHDQRYYSFTYFLTLTFCFHLLLPHLCLCFLTM